MSNRTEEVEQAAVVAWAQSRIAEYPELAFLFHVPNGGKRSAFVGAQMKALGVRRGVPDLLLPLHKWQAGGGPECMLPHARHGLVIEMKSAKGRPSPEQLAWFDHFKAQGWIVTVARSREAAIYAISAYLAGNFDLIPGAGV